jgi:hypothetical protein
MEDDPDEGTESHAWTEVARRVTATPFYLRRATGQRIRVDVGDDVFLVDEIDRYVRKYNAVRFLTAQLLPGDRVFAKGELRWELDSEAPPKGYRDARMGWVLKPPSGEILHVSTEPLGARLEVWARFHRASTAWSVATMVPCQIVCWHEPFAPLGLVIICILALLLVPLASWCQPLPTKRWYEGALVHKGFGQLQRDTGLEGLVHGRSRKRSLASDEDRTELDLF